MKGNIDMEICHFCGNTHLSHKAISYTYQRNGHFLMIHDVPCIRCDYCGENYFAASVLKRIEHEFDAIYLHGKKARQELRIPVETFLELAAM
jgi:YgiT-type zinc finger domain-containing protein